jgi:hypothetical protein
LFRPRGQKEALGLRYIVTSQLRRLSVLSLAGRIVALDMLAAIGPGLKGEAAKSGMEGKCRRHVYF